MLSNLLRNSKLAQDGIILLLSVFSLLLGRKYLPVRVKTSKKLMKKGGAQPQSQPQTMIARVLSFFSQQSGNNIMKNILTVMGYLFLFPISIVYYITKKLSNFTNNNIIYWIVIPLFLFILLNTIFISHYHEKLRDIDISEEDEETKNEKIKNLNNTFGYTSNMTLFHKKNWFLRMLEYWFTSIYYTFTCLSTVGFGDISPVGVIPRTVFIIFISYASMSVGNYFFSHPKTETNSTQQ